MTKYSNPNKMFCDGLHSGLKETREALLVLKEPEKSPSLNLE